LNKIFFPEIPIEIKSDSVEVFEKEDAKFEAILSKTVNKRDVAWNFKGLKLTESLKYGLECEKENNKHILIVRDSTLQDAGEYLITVRNYNFKVNLTVKGKLVKN
jgi:hypothetical protein